MTPKARLQVDAPNESSSQGTATVRSRNIEFHVEQAVARATNWLLSAQTQDGYWWAELEADTTLESDYVLYLHILGQLESEKTAKLANYIRRKQLPDGGWNIFEGGPSELNATVKAYVALRLAGDSATRTGAAASERARTGTGWLGSDEFLRAILPGNGWRRGLEHRSFDSAGTDALAGLVSDQYSRDVFLDARDCDSAGDRFRIQAGLAVA